MSSRREKEGEGEEAFRYRANPFTPESFAERCKVSGFDVFQVEREREAGKIIFAGASDVREEEREGEGEPGVVVKFVCLMHWARAARLRACSRR